MKPRVNILMVMGILISFMLGYGISSTNYKQEINALKRDIVNVRAELATSGIRHLVETRASTEKESNAVNQTDSNYRPETAGTSLAYQNWVSDHMIHQEKKRISDFQRKVKNEYTPLLTSLGLNEEQIDLVKSNRVELLRKAMIAGDAQGELAQARNEYIDNLKTMMSSNDFNKYKYYEESKPASSEFSKIEEYAFKNGTPLPSNLTNVITSLIKNSNATPIQYWDGPFAILPTPLIGENAVINLKNQIESLRNTSLDLLNAANENNLPEDIVSLLDNYYGEQLSKMEKQYSFSNRSAEEISNEIHNFIENRVEQLREKSSAQRNARDTIN